MPWGSSAAGGGCDGFSVAVAAGGVPAASGQGAELSVGLRSRSDILGRSSLFMVIGEWGAVTDRLYS
jgi:hypothetical protein